MSKKQTKNKSKIIRVKFEKPETQEIELKFKKFSSRVIEKMLNCITLQEFYQGVPIERRKYDIYGYYMHLITPTHSILDHHSAREVSTVLFLPVIKETLAGELPRNSHYFRSAHIHYHSIKLGVKSQY